VVAGERHTIALSEKGEVFTWGFGRKKLNLLMRLMVNPAGPTGHGVDIPEAITKPTRVKSLEGHNIQRIAAGRNFCIVFNEKNEVYNWGNGEYAAFGDGNNKNYDVPTKNEHFDYLFEEEKMMIKKVKSCESYSVALMDNGKLYGWGSNEHGQMGIKSEIGLEMYETVNFVTEVIREGYEDQKVINFDISDTTLLFQL
jgi:alpha-tubulin suppressor-like RCC1 family protein